MARYWNQIAEEYQTETMIRLDDFHFGPLLPGDQHLKLVPKDLAGKRALEIGCGAGQNSVYLASKNAVCTAFDISSEQIGFGRKLIQSAGVSVDFHEVDMDADWHPCPGPYDFIHATYSLPFSADPKAVIQQAWDRLAPGGHFLLTMGHPLYAGEWLELDEQDGVFLPTYFEPQTDLREIPDSEEQLIGARTYPISTVFRWVREAGFNILRLEEPQAVTSSDPLPYSSEEWKHLLPVLQAVPLVVIFLCQK